MENITKALMMAFSMLIFVIAFAYGMYLINGLTTTSNAVLASIGEKKYYDNIEVSSDEITTRDVGVDTIIPTLYRYYKENYSVKILDKVGNLIQIFDVGLEGSIAKSAAYTMNDKPELVALKNSIYNNSGNRAYLFEAPWTGSTDEHTRARIDYFLNGTKGYINNTLVDYSKESTTKIFAKQGGFLGNYGDKVFEESFVEYAYTGETISTENGLETITGNTQESTKIIITYKLK